MQYNSRQQVYLSVTSGQHDNSAAQCLRTHSQARVLGLAAESGWLALTGPRKGRTGVTAALGPFAGLH